MAEKNSDSNPVRKKKVYEKPAIEWTEPIECRATACAKGDEFCHQQGGPINS